jgi:putative hydrolase of the HAD superfamily
MKTRGLVIFDAFNTLVTARQDSTGTFLTGLANAGLEATFAFLAQLYAASEGFDHSAWSGSRRTYVDWATETLRLASRAGVDAGLAPCIVPALEQLHQAPMVAMSGAVACLRKLRAAGFAIAVCSNWGWDLENDLHDTGLAGDIDVFVTSARTGVRKPHLRIYQSTLDLAGFTAEEAVFVGDGLRTDALGPQSAGISSVLLTSEATGAFSGPQVSSLAEVPDLLTGGEHAVPANRSDHPGHLSDHPLRRRPVTFACAAAGGLCLRHRKRKDS